MRSTKEKKIVRTYGYNSEIMRPGCQSNTVLKFRKLRYQIKCSTRLRLKFTKVSLRHSWSVRFINNPKMDNLMCCLLYFPDFSLPDLGTSVFSFALFKVLQYLSGVIDSYSCAKVWCQGNCSLCTCQSEGISILILCTLEVIHLAMYFRGVLCHHVICTLFVSTE